MGRACVAAGALHENTALTVSRVVKMCGGCRVRTWYTHHRGRKGFLLYVYLPSCLLYKCTIRATILASTAQITQLKERREEKTKSFMISVEFLSMEEKEQRVVLLVSLVILGSFLRQSVSFQHKIGNQTFVAFRVICMMRSNLNRYIRKAKGFYQSVLCTLCVYKRVQGVKSSRSNKMKKENLV